MSACGGYRCDEAMKQLHGDAVVRSCFGGPSERRALEQSLGDVKFQELAEEFL
jgi:hypothetical protein